MDNWSIVYIMGIAIGIAGYVRIFISLKSIAKEFEKILTLHDSEGMRKNKVTLLFAPSLSLFGTSIIHKLWKHKYRAS